MRVVVCDTGPILHLQEADALPLLAKAGEVLIPFAVDQEMTAQVADWPKRRPEWLQVVRLAADVAVQAERWRGAGGLGVGESEAIALAKFVTADWLLTDDAAARVVGSLLGLEVHGSLGVVLWGTSTPGSTSRG